MPYLLLLLVSSCSIFFHSDGPESAKGKQYTINFESADWKQKKDSGPDFVFENQKDGRIHLSNSFCKEFQDEPLDRLAHKTFKAVGTFEAGKGDYTTFNDREAYRLDGIGKVDGVRVELHLLNTRRNNCYFDFVSITPIEKAKDSLSDFEKFLSSVVFK